MKFVRIASLSIISIFVISISVMYFFVLYALPQIMSSENNVKKIENLIHEKTGLQISGENIKFDAKPFLKFNMSADRIEVLSKDNLPAVFVTDLSARLDLFSKSRGKVCAGEVVVNEKDLKNLMHPKKSAKKAAAFDFSKLPEIDIKSAEYIADKGDIKAKNIKYENNILTFEAEIEAQFLQHNVHIGKQGQLRTHGNELLAENLQILIGKSSVNLDGKYAGKKYNFTVKGSSLPVNDIEKYLLFYQKSQDPAKKFIENFQNYSGNINLDLRIMHGGMYGTAVIDELRAETVMFNIPLYFKTFVLDFNRKDITSTAYGKLGDEDVVHTLEITNLGSPDKEVTGTVTTDLTKNFKYVPNLKILNLAQAKVIYNIKHSIINIEYFLNLPAGSDLIYQNAFLGLRDKERRFYFHTIKNGNNMAVEHYDYSLVEPEGIKNILSGEGLLVKENGRMNPHYMTCRTTGYAPASVTGSFGEYIKGGEFSGNLKYDFITNKILGDFEVITTRFKNFFVKSAKITADENNVKIQANGKYDNEDFNCDVNVKNDFEENLTVYNMDLFLDKLILKPGGNKPERKEKPLDISDEEIAEKVDKVKDANITIDKWNISLNEIRKDKIILKNIKLLGSMKNNVFAFSMPGLDFAHGILSADGEYNFSNASSCINFSALNIDSNAVADAVFNLQGQIEGTADATLRVGTFNGLNDIQASAQFSVNNGFLPKIGSTGFMIKKSKIQISDLVNVDLTKRDALQSDIQGTLYLDNSEIKDINLTSKQKYLSMLIDGNYNIDEQYADLNLYGKYNHEGAKGVKIIFVPLNWILKVVFRPEKTMELYRNKLEQIPEIEADEENMKFFRVKMRGDLNNDDVKVQIKGIE